MSELALITGRSANLCSVLRRAGLRTVFMPGERVPQAAVSFGADIVVVEVSDATAADGVELALTLAHEAPRMRVLLMATVISADTFDGVVSALPSVPIVSCDATLAVLRAALASTLLEPRGSPQAQARHGWASAYCGDFVPPPPPGTAEPKPSGLGGRQGG